MGHFPVAAALFDSRQDFVSSAKFAQKDQVFERLNAQITGFDGDVILSSEHFSSRFLTRARIESLFRALPQREKKVVCYVRRQDSMHLAAYATHVLYGRREPIEHDHADVDNMALNYAAYLSLWAQVFGRENVIVRKYDRRQLAGGDIRRDFLSLLGIDDLGDFVLGADQNVSLDARQVEALRQINQHLPALEHGASWDELDFAREVRQRLLPLLPTGEPLDNLADAATRRAILSRFRASNLELERQFLAPGALADWMPEAIDAAETAAVAPPSASDMARIAARLAWELRNQDHAVHELSGCLTPDAPSPTFGQCRPYPAPPEG